MKKLLQLLTLSCLFPALSLAGTPPATLMELAGVRPAPAALSQSVVILIDGQREYVDGALPLPGIKPALTEGARLLQRARTAGTPVIHVVHRGGGSLFNPQSPYFAIAGPWSPVEDETVIEKRLPNAFAGTRLNEAIRATGRKQLIIVGFMTHMCVSSTVRAALDRGYTTTLVDAATATRDLPDGKGGTIPAETVQQASLAALADRFAVVVQGTDDLPD
jgi:nicotinamidase-related amidase